MNRFATTAAATVLLLLPGTAALGESKLLVSGGLNRASVASSEDTGDAQESVMRLAIGLAVGIPVSEGLNLQLGADYSQKGFGLGAEGFGELTTEIDYLELTALVSKPFPVGDRASAYLLAGPALALKLSCQFAGTVLGEEISMDCGDDDGPRGIDLGLAGGIRFEIGLSEKAGLSVSAHYTHGLLNLDDSGQGDLSLKNRALSLRAGLAYSIG